MSILYSCIEFVCGAAISGVTWDVLKGSGQWVVDKFKKRFKDYFRNESFAEDYLKKLIEKETYDFEDPIRDAVLLYANENRNNDREIFRKEFIDWIKENANDFKNFPTQNSVSNFGVNIGVQTVQGGHVEIVGIKYN